MRKYLIKDRNGTKTWGTLTYSDKRNLFKVSFRRDIDIKKEKPPLFVYAFIKVGMYELDREFSLDWVKERIIPKDRQNIDSILKENGLKFYREIDMLELCMGRCTHDNMYLERIS